MWVAVNLARSLSILVVHTDPKNSNIRQFLPASGVCVVYSLKDVTKYCFHMFFFTKKLVWIDNNRFGCNLTEGRLQIKTININATSRKVMTENLN